MWVMAGDGDAPSIADGAEVGSRPVDPVAGKTVAEILGEIVWLMTQDPAGREMKVAEIEALVMPAILARRFHIKYAQVPDMRRAGAVVLQPVEVSVALSSAGMSNQNGSAQMVFTVSKSR